MSTARAYDVVPVVQFPRLRAWMVFAGLVCLGGSGWALLFTLGAIFL